jgi:hypothetical protein
MATQTAVQTVSISRPARGWLKWVLVAGPLAALTFLSGSGAPLGVFWPPSADSQVLIASATGFQYAAFLGLKAAEAVAFGSGIAFLLFGYGAIRTASPALGRAAHLSIAWLLLNWWIHDSLHVHFEGGTAGALLGIEYGFHFTLMIAGGILAFFFARVTERRV